MSLISSKDEVVCVVAGLAKESLTEGLNKDQLDTPELEGPRGVDCVGHFHQVDCDQLYSVDENFRKAYDDPYLQ